MSLADAYPALLKLRAQEASRIEIMPYLVLSDANIRDLISTRPQDMEALNLVPSIPASTLKNVGNAILDVFRVAAPPVAPSTPSGESHDAIASRNLPSSFGRKRKGTGGKLAIDEADELPAPAPAANPPIDANSIPAPDAELYIKYQSEMKSVEALQSAEKSIEEVQKALLRLFCLGYPLQLSRLGVTSSKVLYNAIPTIISLRRGQAASPLQLEQEDLTNVVFITSVTALYPDVHENQVLLALCEWYHDLHPELLLNSARFVEPRTRNKRKEPTALVAPSVSGNSPRANSASSTTSNLPKSTQPAHSTTSGFPKEVARKPTRITTRARAFISGRKNAAANMIQEDSDDEEQGDDARAVTSKTTEDHDPSPTYTEGSTEDEWRWGTRPKKKTMGATPAKKGFKQGVAMSVDEVGLLPFVSNATKERVILTDDDFAASEAAYFADVYSPQQPTKQSNKAAVSPSALPPSSKVGTPLHVPSNATPSAGQKTSFANLPSLFQHGKAAPSASPKFAPPRLILDDIEESSAPLASFHTATTSSSNVPELERPPSGNMSKQASSASSSSPGAGSNPFLGHLTPLDILNRFNSIRSKSATPVDHVQ